MTLFKFQKKAIREVLEQVFIHKHNIVTLKAPTGSGKTVMLSKLVDVIYDIIENGNTAPSLIDLEFNPEKIKQFDFSFIENLLQKAEFVWFSPSTGGLTNQSKSSYDKNIGKSSKTLQEFIHNCDLEENAITFIGMSSINSDDNIVRKESEKPNWNSVIDKKKIDGASFIVIIDESHLNNTDKRRELINGSPEVEGLSPIFQIHASATPDISKGDVVVIVDENDVINEGLITRHIVVNQNLPNAHSEDEENKVLIETAIKKQQEIKKKYEEKFNKGECKELINPLIVIQYPNKNYGDNLFEDINSYLISKGYSDDNGGEIAKWMTVGKNEQKSNLNEITKNDSNVVFLHMKQAISTGWDCPRAKILVKLRDTGSKTFETQVLGRFRRMPERKHYNSKLLDNCFVYTYYSEWITQGKELGSFMENVIVQKKDGISLPQRINKETRDNLSMSIGHSELLNIIKDWFNNKYNLSDDNIEKMKTGGYVFRNNAYLNITVGSVSHLENGANEVKVEKRKRIIKEDSLALNRAYSVINSKIKINDITVIKKILKKLFHKGLLLPLSQQAYIHFIVNNQELLYRDIREALQGKQNQHIQRNSAIIIQGNYKLPDKYDIKTDIRITNPEIFKKNAYIQVKKDITASYVEKRFNDYIDCSPYTDWWFKNGDVGEEFLSIVYMTIIGKQYQFYPDYICSINGKLWVIETKGGEDSEGNDENIDAQAENKFYALKDWAKQNNVNFAFVRYSKLQNKLYISNTDYTDDMDVSNPSSPWKEIEVFFEKIHKKENKMMDVVTLVKTNNNGEPEIILDEVIKEIFLRYPDLEPGDEIKCNKFKYLKEELDADCIKFDINFATNEKIFYFNFKDDNVANDIFWVDRALHFSHFNNFDKDRMKVFWHPNNDSPMNSNDYSVKHQKYISVSF